MESKNYRNGSLIGGLALIVLGLVFFAVEQGAFELDWGMAWPFFGILAGLAMLVMALIADNPRARAGWVFPGTIALLLGVFFLLTTNGILSWSDQGTLWPRQSMPSSLHCFRRQRDPGSQRRSSNH